MRTCHLHVGMPKTGSSSIQETFQGYEDDRLVYADLGKPNHTVPLVAAFRRDPAGFYVFRNAQLSQSEIESRVAAYRTTIDRAMQGQKDVIFSAEGAVDHLGPAAVGDLFAALRGAFDRVRVLIYVRPLASLTASQFQQRIKMGLGRFTLPAPDYRKRFAPFLEHGGAENVTFARFDRKDLHDGDVVQDFARRIGIPTVPDQAPTVNETVSTEALAALYAFNKFVGPHIAPREKAQLLHRLNGLLETHRGTRFALHDGILQAHLDHHRADVAWAESVCGFDVTGQHVAPPDAITSEEDFLSRAVRP